MSTTLNEPNRYQALFNRLQQEQMGAFIPFITLGDPNLERSFEIITTLIESGADALELGIPFSDPLADGPTIQNANLRAFAANVTPDECFALLTKVRQQHPDIPIGLLMYANLVFSNGIDNFYAKCQQTGIDSVLIADVPLEESEEFRNSATKHGIAPVFICPPNADDDLIKTLAQKGAAYTYLLSRAGVTGSENRDHKPLEHLIQKLKENGAPPPVQGFGISEPSQVQESLKMGTAGAISGSAIVQLIEDHLETPEIMLAKIAEFVRSMKAATTLS